jgi:hypothetical protein
VAEPLAERGAGFFGLLDWTIVVLTYQTAPPFLVDDAKQG